jgi:hypothetical protein
MRWATIAILLLTAAAWSGQPANINSIDNYFAKHELVARQYLADNDKIDEQAPPLMGDIYAFKAKNPKRAFFYSLALPGAGEYYAGSRIKPVVFLGVEAILWTGYAVYRNKGANAKKDYMNFADQHYRWWDFKSWWNSIDSTTKANYSHTLPWDDPNNRPLFNREYYENIGKYNEFQVGWDDIGTGLPPPPLPGGSVVNSFNRNHYLDMRRQSNSYYQNASTMLMLALGNHLLSAFDAALTAKSFNKGQKGFSLRLKTKQIGNSQVPILTWNCTF